jgi:hypothetical protein
MWLSVDSKLVGRKRKLKELSLEIPIKRADTLHRVESNTDIFAKARIYRPLRGHRPWHARHSYDISTWETLFVLYSEKVRLTSDKKVRKPNTVGSQITA